MIFWIVTIALALAVAGLLVMALLRRQTGAEPPAAYDLRVYRDQLREVDRDLARGVIDAADAERVRAEVSRRILAADAQLQAQMAEGGKAGPGGLAEDDRLLDGQEDRRSCGLPDDHHRMLYHVSLPSTTVTHTRDRRSWFVCDQRYDRQLFGFGRAWWP